MASNALVLSDGAEMSNKPELEIYADDVQCGHGATAGALDEELLFYLQARGIPANEAAALLIQSFVGEIVDEVAAEAVREALTGEVLRWLARRG
jgi:Fe-S cluster assembly protein SufD